MRLQSPFLPYMSPLAKLTCAQPLARDRMQSQMDTACPQIQLFPPCILSIQKPLGDHLFLPIPIFSFILDNTVALGFGKLSAWPSILESEIIVDTLYCI